MKIILKIFKNIIWVAIAIGILVIAENLLNPLFSNISQKFYENITGPFLGAFFAFIFVIIAAVFKRIYERKLRHYNALVKLEIYLNKNFQTISHNKLAFKSYIESLKLVSEKQIELNASSLNQFYIADEFLLELHSKNIINNFFSYNQDLLKINIDFETYTKFYEQIIKFALAYNKPEFYKNYSEKLIAQCYDFLKFLDKIYEQTKSLLIEIRASLEFKPLLSRFMSILRLDQEPWGLKKRIKKHTILLEQELNQSYRKDSDELKKFGLEPKKD